MESICQCTRCKKKHLESERKNKPRSDGCGTDSVCPSCGCKSFYDLNELTISVKDNLQTFTARCLGKSASCTANAAHAAMNCAKKVYSDGEYTLTEKPDNRRGYQTFIAVLKVV